MKMSKFEWHHHEGALVGAILVLVLIAIGAPLWRAETSSGSANPTCAKGKLPTHCEHSSDIKKD